MRLEILHVPDCPNAGLLERRLLDALGARRDEIELTLRMIDDPELATELGMTGSPTLLVDGRDPFAEPGRPPSLSCRLYRDERDAPSVAALRNALPGTRPP